MTCGYILAIRLNFHGDKKEVEASIGSTEVEIVVAIVVGTRNIKGRQEERRKNSEK